MRHSLSGRFRDQMVSEEAVPQTDKGGLLHISMYFSAFVNDMMYLQAIPYQHRWSRTLCPSSLDSLTA